MQWERTLLFFKKKSQKFSPNQKTTSHLSFPHLYLVNYIIVKNRVCLHLFSHRLSLTILEYANSLLLPQHENGILIFDSQLFPDHQLHVFSILLFDCKVEFFLKEPCCFLHNFLPNKVAKHNVTVCYSPDRQNCQKSRSLFLKIHWSVSLYPQLFLFSIYITK